jgi:hypothetical protein
MNLRALAYGMIIGLLIAVVLYFFVLESDADASEINLPAQLEIF